MKELQSVPEEDEIKASFTQTSQRRISEGDTRQNNIWISFFSHLTGLQPQEYLENRLLLLSEIVTKLRKTADIDDTLHLDALRHGETGQDIETAMIAACTSFHIRYVESEYRLSLDKQLADDIFTKTDSKSVNYDVYGSTGSARVRFSPEFKQVRFNVKVPICEYPDGRRTRLKFEYRGNPPGNQQFENDAKLVAIDFLSSGEGSILIKQSIEIIKRDSTNPPVWINRELILEDRFRYVFDDGSASRQEKHDLLDKILADPVDFTHAGNEYWLEIDANNETEMQNCVSGYLSRSNTPEKKSIFSSAVTMK